MEIPMSVYLLYVNPLLVIKGTAHDSAVNKSGKEFLQMCKAVGLYNVNVGHEEILWAGLPSALC